MLRGVDMEEELELRQYWEILRRRWKIVVLLPLIAVFISEVLSFFVLQPSYLASTTLIVGMKASEFGPEAERILNYNVLMANQQLAKTYATIAHSKTVEQNVIETLNLPFTVEELDKMIAVNQMKDTELLEIKVTSTVPGQATAIANTMVQEFSKAVIEMKKVDFVSIVDSAVIPDKPVKPNKILNVLIAFVVGLMVSVGLVFLLEYLDNTLKTSSEVENLLGIPVLGTIPTF